MEKLVNSMLLWLRTVKNNKKYKIKNKKEAHKNIKQTKTDQFLTVYWNNKVV